MLLLKVVAAGANIQKSKLVAPCVLACLLSSTLGLGASTNSQTGPLKRYLAFTEAAASEAVFQGARVVQETKGLKAVVCSPALAQALGLVEDIPMHAADTAANSQVMAASPQELGLTGRGRTIVVLDTGYNYRHPELVSSYLGGKDFINHDDDPFDDNGHGSHVAGIITGDGIDPRARGIAPAAGIVAGKVLDRFGDGYVSDIVAGIYWAIDGPDGYFGTADDFHADVINISIGSSGGYMFSSLFCDAAVPSMTDAIKYAIDHGVAVVVAAGNNGSGGVALPGCVSYSLTVGAVNASNVLASFSGTGPSVDLVAPGIGLFSASLGTNYKSMDGTSQATPVVSGTIALLKEAYPNASPVDLEQVLLNTAGDLGVLGKDNRYGWGELNVNQALRSLTVSLASISLHLARSNDHLLVSWPIEPPGFVLQASTRFGDRGNWSTVTNLVIRTDTEYRVLLPSPASNCFFRLQWQ